MVGGNQISIYGRMKLDPYLISPTKICTIWSKGLIMKHKALKILEV
jgi:hypothetical protein